MIQLTPKQIQRLRKVLLKERAELEKRLQLNDHFGLSNSLGDMTGELSTYDNHPADISTEIFERGKDIALNENTEHHLEDVIVALRNIEAGHYGICLTCNTAIPYKRLEAIPTAQYCIQHVPDKHVSQHRPIEEKVLAHAFGRTGLFEPATGDRNDGENAWEIVESWGTATSPVLSEEDDDIYYEDAEFVEPLESFLATDLYGQSTTVIRNNEYYKYIADNEGDHGLEVK